jgi:photosystem II stability/assembly factor-like uncharacterized protein
MVVIRQIFLIIISLLVLEGCKSQTRNSVGDKIIVKDKTWKVIGPGGGGGVLKPTVSPFNENFVMAHCDMTGVYVSHNGGENWKMKNLWNVPDDFEFDPLDSNTVYIATRGFLHSEDRGSGISLLLRSVDKGENWEIIFPDISKSKKVERLQSTSLLPSQLIAGAFDCTIQKVRVDMEDNNRIYLGLAPLVDYMAGGSKRVATTSAKLVLSTDRGKSWRVVAGLSGKKVLGIFPSGRNNQVVVFTETACIWVNEITGETKILPLPVTSIIAVEGGKNKGQTLVYIQSDLKIDKGTFNGGMYVSDNSGETWRQVNEGLLKDLAPGRVPDFRQGMAVCSSKPEVAYISTINPVINTKGQPEEIYCIFKTVNAGKNWLPVLLSSTPGGYITKNFKGSWMEESFDPGWGGSPIDLGVAPGNPDVCFAGDNGRGYKTTDGGKTWEQVYSHNNPDGSYSNTGLNVTTCYGVHFDPFDTKHFFICYTDMGLFHTYNGGESWYHSITNIPGEWQNTCYDVTFDQKVKDRVWSVWANAHDLPRTKMFGGSGFDSYSGGVAVSTNGGRTWQKSNKGLPDNAVCTNILLDQSVNDESQTIFVSVFDKGIYKSTDGGKTWKETNAGLGKNLFAWQLRQNANGRIFVLFARGESKGNVVDGAIYCSDDKAASWRQLSLPEGINGPHDLLIDPLNPKIMYVSCWPRTIDGKDTLGGVIKTEDGGLNWKQVFDDRVRVNSAGIDPKESNVLYINTFQNAAYRSENYGESWKRIEGYRFKWGQRAIPDINNRGMLFLTTYGGSVFYGPAKGIPNASDDIVNMPEGWW